MADCIHKTLVRVPINGLELASIEFRFRCSKCDANFIGVLEGSEQHKDFEHAMNATPELPSVPDFRPDHQAVLNRAEQAWSAAGYQFERWRQMLSDGGITQPAFRRMATSLGFEPGDVDQLLAAVRATDGEDPS